MFLNVLKFLKNTQTFIHCEKENFSMANMAKSTVEKVKIMALTIISIDK